MLVLKLILAPSIALSPFVNASIPPPTPTKPFTRVLKFKLPIFSIAPAKISIAFAKKIIDMPALTIPLGWNLDNVLLTDLKPKVSIVIKAPILNNAFVISEISKSAIDFIAIANIPTAAAIVRSVPAFIPCLNAIRALFKDPSAHDALVNISFVPRPSGPKFFLIYHFNLNNAILNFSININTLAPSNPANTSPIDTWSVIHEKNLSKASHI